MFDLPAEKITPALVVEQGRGWLTALIKREARFAGDFGPARERITRRYKLPKSKVWSLLYRKPKDLCGSLFLKLHAAYRAECARQMEALAHELEKTEILSPRAHSVAKAHAFMDADYDQERLTP